MTNRDSEWAVHPLNDGCTVDIENGKYQLPGRGSVFSGVADFAYAPRGARAQIASGAGGRFALAGAKCERRLPARYGPAPEVPVAMITSGGHFEIDGPNGSGRQRVFPSHEGGSDVLTEVRTGEGSGGPASTRTT